MKKIQRYGWSISLIAIGLVFLFTQDLIINVFLEGIDKDKYTWFENTLSFIFGSLGYNALAILLIVAGAFNILVINFFTDFLSVPINSLPTEISSAIEKGISNLDNSIKKATGQVDKFGLIASIHSDAIDKNDRSELLGLLVKKAFSSNSHGDLDYGEFIKRAMFDAPLKNGKVIREQNKNTVHIDEIDNDNERVLWTETARYHLRNLEHSEVLYDLIPHTGFWISNSQNIPEELIERCKYTINTNHNTQTIVDLRNYLDKYKDAFDPASPTTKWSYEDRDAKNNLICVCTIEFDGQEVLIDLKLSIKLKPGDNYIEIHEETLMPIKHDVYTLVNKRPVKTTDFSMNIPRSLKFTHFDCSTSHFYKDIDRERRLYGWAKEPQDDQRALSAFMNDWVLPGIVLTVGWGPRDDNDGSTHTICSKKTSQSNEASPEAKLDKEKEKEKK